MNRLLFFPEPYPDEDFRSLIYRYHLRSSNNNLYETNRELFDKKSRKYLLFPTRMERLYERLPYGNSFALDELILKHTWSGLILAFKEKERGEEFLNVIKKGTQNPLWINSNFSSDFFSKTIKYCTQCIKEDFEEYGECYVHRKHQFSFINFCYKHFVKLTDRCSTCDKILAGNDSRGLISVPFCVNNHALTNEFEKKLSIDKENKIKIELFNLICALSENHSKLNSTVIYHKILMGLWKNNFIHYKGRILKKELISALISNYGVDTLQAITININYISHRSFLARSFVEDMNQNILFYILVIHFLFKSFDTFMSVEIEIANQIPFGNGPWKCLNKICKGYNQKIISKVERIPKESGGMVISGEFTCPICGQVYAKRWKRGKISAEKVMIKTMGQKWNDRVLDLYLMGYSANQIAIELKCSESAVRNNLYKVIGFSRTIRKNEKEVLNQIISSQQETASTNDLEELKENYRNHILCIIKKASTLSRTDIYIKANYKKYQWLKLNDGEWLESNLPAKRKNKKDRLDFTSFDKELARKIKKVSKELYRKHPYQIKKTTILKKLTSVERSRLNGKLSDRLPLSSLVLKKSIEPLNCYLIRRLPIVVESLLNKGYKNISLDNLKGKFYIYRKCDSKTEAIIKNMLNQMGFIE
ncbi:TnsD family Tn7-like transposition protein [Bacillus sp. JJ1773]|uniref:TnsD family Tn7-like transposition protein n=1 Tax=Bacillus sp. JJ1773 TaxID=3122965 RepID=UPI003000E586